jgi:predicted  nucleic acid-binding Zn-ribbon protein
MEDESFELEIAEMEQRLRPLRVKYEDLRRKLEAKAGVAAHLEALYSEEKELERDIANMEGRPYHDEDDPEGADEGEPPDT